MRIVVDAMGGDQAPGSPVRAALQFAGSHPEIHLMLVGQRECLQPLLPSTLPNNFQVLHASEVITGNEEPVHAVRRKPNSSLVTAARMVKEGQAEVMLSAGSTGALVASGLLIIGRLPGISRPALAPVLPTLTGGRLLLLDAGATMDADAGNLLQYAHMGALYSRHVLGVEQPRVALLNVGEEPGKGNHVTKQAYSLFEQANFQFTGNLESRELLEGRADVLVCDGFVGNVVLKAVEGLGLGMFRLLREAMTQSLHTKLAAAVLKPSLQSLRNRFDYSEVGGAPFLGVNGGCIKAHGSSNERAWFTALEQSLLFVRQGVLQKMGERLQTTL
ncbi:phosphate acyltransferase PlsX [Alicyclobacillaceae bacterium I2511]|nr:phosphate acyltransferase PlsX [Alicyclobacillaceae bacterium I2511]